MDNKNTSSSINQQRSIDYVNELKLRLNDLRMINTSLQQKHNVTDSILISTNHQKEQLLQALKECDNELYSLDSEIEMYYNELFNELTLEKNKTILSNLTILKEFLDKKALTLNKRRELVEEKEEQLNKQISMLTPSQLELFNQIMSKIDQDDKNIDESIIDTSTVRIEYEKMKNIHFNEIADEIKLMLQQNEKRNKVKHNNSYDHNISQVLSKKDIHNHLSTSMPKSRSNHINILNNTSHFKKQLSTDYTHDAHHNTSINSTNKATKSKEQQHPKQRKVKSTRISRFQSKFFSQELE